jgi:hypothetical protein
VNVLEAISMSLSLNSQYRLLTRMYGRNSDRMVPPDTVPKPPSDVPHGTLLPQPA